MDYKKVYQELVISRQKMGRKKILNKKGKQIGTYYENHHIYPKRFGGTNKKDNMVLLTPREHLLAHLLLVFCYEGEKQKLMASAVKRMCTGLKDQRNFSTRQYEFARLIWYEFGGHTEKTKAIIKEKRALQTNIRKNPVAQLTLTGEVIAEFESVTAAIKATGINGIRRCLLDEDKSSKGFKWKYTDPVYRHRPVEAMMGDKNPSKRPEQRQRVSEQNKNRPAWNVNSDYVTSEKTREKMALAKRGKPNGRKGVKIAQDKLDNGYGKSHPKPVLQFSKDGTLLNEFPSVSAACRSIGLKSITSCCHGNTKTAGGYIWKFKERE